jgi:hypothetical protein
MILNQPTYRRFKAHSQKRAHKEEASRRSELQHHMFFKVFKKINFSQIKYIIYLLIVVYRYLSWDLKIKLKINSLSLKVCILNMLLFLKV